MDANFKLKQKERGFSDPPLSNGLAYMIPNDRLQEHLAQCADKDLTTEVSTLGLWSSLIGVDFLPVRSILAVRLSMQSARLIRSMPRDMRSLALVGLIAPDMASSDRMASLTYNEANGKSHTHGSLVAMKLIGIISYLNMDLALLSTLLPSLTAGISRVLVSYDIACQWHKNFEKRLANYPTLPSLRLSDFTYWKVAVPKFHLAGHGNKCQASFNLAYTKWAGRMDGERIESGWAQTTSMATWTRESGPNARRGILDDHWGASNWQKLLGLRECSA
jgi:hypothetical protein